MADGKFSDLESLITRRIPLEDVVEKGIKALLEQKEVHGKYTCPTALFKTDQVVKSSQDLGSSLTFCNKAANAL